PSALLSLSAATLIEYHMSLALSTAFFNSTALFFQSPSRMSHQIMHIKQIRTCNGLLLYHFLHLPVNNIFHDFFGIILHHVTFHGFAVQSNMMRTK
ncbi:MAG: hypothetical protein K2O06_03765, partial [Acetatifactor sp.]|nr:hypothetical protein [Acetatifactor sp.]